MRLTIAPEFLRGEYFAVARPHESWCAPATLTDSFTLDLREHRLVQTDAAKPTS